MTSGLIDAHHHLWPAEAVPSQTWRPAADEPLRRAFELDELEAEAQAAGVVGTVLMQSVDDAAENERVGRYAAAGDLVRGVVAWAPLIDPVAAREVIEAIDVPRLVGVRCLIGSADADWAIGPDGRDNFARLADRGLTWDVVPITENQLRAVERVAETSPGLRVIVDHLARPPLDGADDGPWRSAIDRLAALPNVAIKLSVGVDVLASGRPWDREALRPYVRYALTRFGADRCMLGSNWPVVLLATDYGTAIADMRDLIADEVTGDELDRVVAGTATAWYGLEAS